MNSGETQRPLHIAIIGGGIGGLTLALAIQRSDKDQLIKIDIYESASEMKQLGAGITVWPRTWELLERLGLTEQLAKYLPEQNPTSSQSNILFSLRKADQPTGVHIRDLCGPAGPYGFHRAEIQQALLQNISSSAKFHLSHHLTSYEETDTGITLHFENGTTAVCDLIVGADGVKSNVRRNFIINKHPSMKASIDPMWSGAMIYRALFDSKLLAEKMPDHRALTTPMVYFGKNKHIVCYPLLQGRLINVVAYYTQYDKLGTTYEGEIISNTTKAEVMSHFTTWEEEVRMIVSCIGIPSRWALEYLYPLSTYSSGRVFLMGDAAHAMPPHLGAGAGQAIEDAYLLSKIILQTKSIPDKAELYNRICQPAGNATLDLSCQLGRIYEFALPGCEDIHEGDLIPQERLIQFGNEAVQLWSRNWDTTSVDNMMEIIAMV